MSKANRKTRRKHSTEAPAKRARDTPVRGSFYDVVAGIDERALKWVVAPMWRVDPGQDRPTLISDIVAAAADTGLADLLARYSSDTRALLWLLASAQGPVPPARLVDVFGNGPTPRLVTALQAAKAALLVVPDREGHLVVPGDLAARLRDILGRSRMTAREAEPQGPVSFPTPDPIAEIAETYAFVVGRGTMRVTQQGTLFRNDIKAFAKHLEGDDLDEDDITEAGRRLENLRRLGLVRFSGNSAEAAHDAWRRFMAAPRDQVLAQLLAMHTLQRRDGTALLALAGLRPDHWYPTERTLAALSAESARDPKALLAPQESFLSVLAEALVGLGLAAVEGEMGVARTEDGGQVTCPDCGEVHGAHSPSSDPYDDDFDDESDALEDAFVQLLAGAVGSPDPEGSEDLDWTTTGSTTTSGHFAVSSRLAAVVTALFEGPSTGEGPVKCLVVNPDFEAVIMVPEAPPAVLGLLARWGSPKPGLPVWRLDRRPRRPLSADELAPYLVAPLPDNVAQTLDGRTVERSLRITPAILIEGDQAEALADDPAWTHHTKVLAPGLARIHLDGPDRLAALAKRIGTPKWDNIRLLAGLLGQETPSAAELDAHYGYGYGAKAFATGLGISASPGALPDPQERVARTRQALTQRPTKGPSLDVRLPSAPHLRKTDEVKLLLCHRAALQEATIEAAFTAEGWWSRERIDAECRILSIQHLSTGIVVVLAPVGGARTHRVELSGLTIKTPRRERSLKVA